MRSGGVDDFDESDHKTNAVVDETESWRCLDPF